MKLNKIFAAIMAVVTLVGFSACKNEGQDVIKLKLDKVTLEVGQSYTVPVEKASGDITWASSNVAIATVNAGGTVTAVAEGSAAITATVGKASASLNVTVVGGSGPEPGEEIPEVEAPAEGFVTLVIQIPAGSECNGIAFKGTIDGSAWTGANQYLSENGPAAPDACIKFEAIKDSKEWFKATYKLGAEAWGEDGIRLAGKICLIYADDGSWEGQAKEWAFNEEYSTADYSMSGDGNVQVHTTGLVYVKVDKWNKSECAEVVIKDRHVVLTVPTDDCGFEVPSIVGSFNGWNATEIAMTPVAGQEGKYEATVKADAADEFKFAGSVSGWENEIRVYNPEEDVYADNNPNIPFGDEVEFNIDYSTGKWKACSEN